MSVTAPRGPMFSAVPWRAFPPTTKIPQEFAHGFGREHLYRLSCLDTAPAAAVAAAGRSHMSTPNETR